MKCSSEWVRADPHGRVGAMLRAASARLAAEGMPGTKGQGQLFRPLVAVAGLSGLEAPPVGFWDAVLAVQLAHEASLLHDDVVDGAGTRRGAATEVAAGGIAHALILGDHLLTSSYRAAVRTGNLAFVGLFARSVERTVAGEAEQGRSAGGVLEQAQYERIVMGKSGELLGCSLAAAAVLAGRADADARFELGRRIGLLYQMLDDLLDYCPATETGKPPLSDYRSERWTWPLGVQRLGFGLERQELLDALYRSEGAAERGERMALRLAEEAGGLLDEIARLLPGDEILPAMIAAWIGRGRVAIEQEMTWQGAPAETSFRPIGTERAGESLPRVHVAAGGGAEAVSAVLRERVPAAAHAVAYMAANSRSFRFAARFFRAPEAERVAGVYAFCRVMDDLVDRPPSGCSPDEALQLWLDLSRRAYEGEPSGFPLLDRVMGEMAEREVPFEYVVELGEGMRMDLRHQRFASLDELRTYTFRVASVVGLWLTRLWGRDDPAILERAVRLGHAMQMTNILRDVGEDLRRGRLYLPADLLHKHGVFESDLREAAESGRIPPGYTKLLEELMTLTEADYSAGVAGLVALPAEFARAVAVAAYVYRGIHDGIRRNGYDNLRHSAATKLATKAILAARALLELRDVGSGTPPIRRKLIPSSAVAGTRIGD